MVRRNFLVVFLSLSIFFIATNILDNPVESFSGFLRSALLGKGRGQAHDLNSELDSIFEEAYNRGMADDSSRINIEVPSRRWLRRESQPDQSPYRQDALTKQEFLTAREAKDDMGGIIRLEAVNSRFAHKIQGLLGSIQSKLNHAHQPQNGLLVPETATADQILDGIKPLADTKWDKLLSQLDEKIVSSHHHESELGSMEAEARYENAFRRALDPMRRRQVRRRSDTF